MGVEKLVVVRGVGKMLSEFFIGFLFVCEDLLLVSNSSLSLLFDCYVWIIYDRNSASRSVFLLSISQSGSTIDSKLIVRVATFKKCGLKLSSNPTTTISKN